MRTISIFVFLIGTTLVMACSDDQSTNAGTKGNPKTVYASTLVEPRGSMIALTTTQQLTVVPLGLDGDTLEIPSTKTFWSSDSSHVLISQTGVISGVASTGSTPVAVIVRVQAGGVTREDTAYVAVTDVAYQPVSMQLTTPYGAESFFLFGQVMIVPEVTDVNETVISGAYAYLSGNRTVQANQFGSSVTASKLGKVWVTGTLTAYGVKLVDSVQVKFTPIPFASVVIDSTAAGKPRSESADIGLWFPALSPFPFSNNTSSPVTITFSGPAPLPADLELAANGGADFPIFTTPGTYTWTVKSSSPVVSGTIIIPE